MADCDIHKHVLGDPTPVPAVFDGKTKAGPWAFMCAGCAPKYAATEEGPLLKRLPVDVGAQAPCLEGKAVVESGA